MPQTTTDTTVAPATPGLPPVAVLRWPEQDAERHRLAALGRPRVLLTAVDVAPPTLLDDRELWLRDGDDLAELHGAVERLRRDAAAAFGRPMLDDDGFLHHDGRWVRVPPRQLAVIELLVRHFRRVVARDELVAVYSGVHQPISRAATAALTQRLDGCVSTVGLHLSVLRRRGFLLGPMAADQGVDTPNFT